MKKYETLKKELEALKDEAKAKELYKKLEDIAQNEAVKVKALKEREAMYLLQYEQLAKALKNAKYNLVLDINYEAFRSDDIKLEISSLLDTANKRVLHLYSHNSYFDIVISSNKATKAKLEYVEALNEYFTIKQKKNYETTITKVSFDDMIKACDFAKLILETKLEDLKAMSEAKKQ